MAVWSCQNDFVRLSNQKLLLLTVHGLADSTFLMFTFLLKFDCNPPISRAKVQMVSATDYKLSLNLL